MTSGFREQRTLEVEYEDGHFTGAPDTWVTGGAKAEGGILVPGHPRAGQRFAQGRAPAIEFYDAGLVKRRYTAACSVHHCYQDALLIEESSPLAPEDGKQTKYYAPGVGLIKVGAEGGDSRESMKLSMIRYPRTAEREQIRAAVLRMERRAYRVSATYRQTSPVTRCICRHN